MYFIYPYIQRRESLPAEDKRKVDISVDSGLLDLYTNEYFFPVQLTDSEHRIIELIIQISIRFSCWKYFKEMGACVACSNDPYDKKVQEIFKKCGAPCARKLPFGKIDHYYFEDLMNTKNNGRVIVVNMMALERDEENMVSRGQLKTFLKEHGKKTYSPDQIFG